MRLTWGAVTTGSSEYGAASKDPPDISRGDDQIEALALLESPVVELWEDKALKSEYPSKVDPPKEAIEAPLVSALRGGTLLAPLSCTTGSVIMEAAAVLARINCRLSSGEARTIKNM